MWSRSSHQSKDGDWNFAQVSDRGEQSWGVQSCKGTNSCYYSFTPTLHSIEFFFIIKLLKTLKTDFQQKYKHLPMNGWLWNCCISKSLHFVLLQEIRDTLDINTIREVMSVTYTVSQVQLTKMSNQISIPYCDVSFLNKYSVLIQR